jgi:site-specific DNA-methyltransferase (adenine-specific)
VLHKCTFSFSYGVRFSGTRSKSLQSYYTTRFFRFLASVRKITQDATHSVYTWVPVQTWNRTWTDVALYDKYGISAEERSYIESQVKAMSVANGDDE